MNPVISKLKSAIQKPHLIYPYLEKHIKFFVKLIKLSKYRLAIYLLLDGVDDGERSFSRIPEKQRLYKMQIMNNTMFLDLAETGIHRDLFTYGIREARATRVYREKLKEIGDKCNKNINILEIGANIGYFALMPPEILNNNCNVYAIEPEPDNYKLLQKNITENGYKECFTTWNGAISNEVGTSSLTISDNSNCHRISDDQEENGDSNIIKTPTTTGTQFIKEHGLKNSDINVIRMDIEGYEGHALEGMSEIIYNSSPLVIFIEFHPRLEQLGKVESTVQILEENGLEIVSTSDFDKEFGDVNNFSDAIKKSIEVDRGIEVVAVK